MMANTIIATVEELNSYLKIQVVMVDFSERSLIAIAKNNTNSMRAVALIRSSIIILVSKNGWYLIAPTNRRANVLMNDPRAWKRELARVLVDLNCIHTSPKPC
jgi:hypothetical protein